MTYWSKRICREFLRHSVRDCTLSLPLVIIRAAHWSCPVSCSVVNSVPERSKEALAQQVGDK